MITERKANVYRVILDMFWQSVFSGVSAVAFCLILRKLLQDPSWPVAAVEMFLTGTMYRVFGYYFPNKQ